MKLHTKSFKLRYFKVHKSTSQYFMFPKNNLCISVLCRVQTVRAQSVIHLVLVLFVIVTHSSVRM